LGPLASNRVDNFFIGPLTSKKSICTPQIKFNIKSNQKEICEKNPKLFNNFFSLESLGIGQYMAFYWASLHTTIKKKVIKETRRAIPDRLFLEFFSKL
jgi:hypothetical protein